MNDSHYRNVIAATHGAFLIAVLSARGYHIYIPIQFMGLGFPSPFSERKLRPKRGSHGRTRFGFRYCDPKALIYDGEFCSFLGVLASSL